jgi:hypothetical protein
MLVWVIALFKSKLLHLIVPLLGIILALLVGAYNSWAWNSLADWTAFVLFLVALDSFLHKIFHG